MSHPEFWRRLWQAKLPILMAVLVAVLVIFALGADERRQCRQACLKAGHPDYRYMRAPLGGAPCECVTASGQVVPPPSP
jgi:hypothetical protein